MNSLAQRYELLTSWLKEHIDSASLEEIAHITKEQNIEFNGVLGDAELLAAIRGGQIICDPFDIELLSSNSYDVRLGGNFWVGEKLEHQNDFSPYNEAAVKKYYQGPYKAITHLQWQQRYGRKFPGIADNEFVIVLRPGECILAHTVEFFGALYGATTMMKAKSSLGRINISACDDAGLGDVGYVSRWTMEIRNKNKDVSVPLVVGMPIAQIVTFWVAGATINYGHTGHYQNWLSIEQLKESWVPDSMLPRFFSEKNTRIRRKLLTTPQTMF